ncbi:MAG: VOC family protein [Desulfosalsimonadaceae bacterium]|nr:VOC family protein [Desulfosalsimonadaceae bacterium]
MNDRFKSGNTILYCRQWEATVAFYRDGLKLPVSFSNDWFVEFIVSGNTRLSVADETRASIKSGAGNGITLSLETDDLDIEWNLLVKSGLSPYPIQNHPWNARVFYIRDPEGHRIEFWQSAGACGTQMGAAG